jgi:predicted dehydrogenase
LHDVSRRVSHVQADELAADRHGSGTQGGSAAYRDRASLRVAVVGYGSIGRRHLTNLKQLGVNRQVVVRRRSANAAFSSPPGAIVVHGDDQAIDQGIDAAILCNPTRLHVAAAETYLAAGAAVLIEKPLCAGGQEDAAARLAVLARQRGLIAGVAYCLRYHPAYRLAHEMLSAGRLGKLLTARAWFQSYLPDWHPWEDYRQSYAARRDLGGGVLPTLDHEIDFLNWCLGEPAEVMAQVTNTGALGIDVPDSALLRMGYPGKVFAEVLLSFCCRQRSRGFEVVGQRGSLRFDWSDGVLELVERARSPQPLWREQIEGQDSYDLNQMYLALLDDFLWAVQTGHQAPVPLEAGLSSAAVCHKALAHNE